MHHYPFNVGDYIRKTAHLSVEEDCAYRRLLDLYYETEKPIPNETQTVSRRLRMGSQTVIVESILKEFFTLQDDNCWHQTHCDEVISAYQSKCEHNKIAGLKGGRPKKNPDGFQTVYKNNPNQNHKPITNNQEPIEKAISSPKGSRYPLDAILTAKWGNAALELRADFDNDDVRIEFDAFKDYWCAKPGKDGIKLDWLATWRNWCRNSKRKGKNSNE